MALEFTGACELCGQKVPRAQIAPHLATCAPKYDRHPRGERLVHLQIEADGAPEYWLYVEGRGTASLEQLDSLLRRVWLECCGHLSAFRRGKTELRKRSSLASLPDKGLAFQYDYDFGSTTSLLGRVSGYREGSLGRNVLRVLARNAPLNLPCDSCGAPATLVCPSCFGTGPSLFCKSHAPRHPCHEEGMWMPTVNSPRMGVCGYTG